MSDAASPNMTGMCTTSETCPADRHTTECFLGLFEPDLTRDGNDPRYTYPELSPHQAYRGWPCAGHFSDGTECRTRRDEHADQEAVPSRFLSLDITDHVFIPAEDKCPACADLDDALCNVCGRDERGNS